MKKVVIFGIGSIVGNKIPETIKTIGLNWKTIGVLQRLYSDGIRMCCVSDKNKITTNSLLKRIGCHEFFDKVITTDDIDPWISPNQYNLAISEMKTDERSCLAIDLPESQPIKESKIRNVNFINDPNELSYDKISLHIKS